MRNDDSTPPDPAEQPTLPPELAAADTIAPDWLASDVHLGSHGSPRYQVVDELGRGGMGRVLRVRDPEIGREVAQKVLLGSGAAAEVLQRFEREARITGQLEHPGIIPVYDKGTDEAGERYFTMKLVRGRSLAELLLTLREGADPGRAAALPDLVRLLLRICEAVAYAHSQGVVHRDLKPANVMIGDFGEVLVLDWGLAKQVGHPDDAATWTGSPGPDDATLTQVGSLLGTPLYMPPEQAAGEQDLVDLRSDVYALGAILYELLALRPPFVGDLVGVLHSVLTQPPLPAAHAAPVGRRVPADLDAIARRALAKEPHQRYPTVESFGADLMRWLDGLPVSARPLGPLRRSLKWAARHPGLLGGLAAIGVVAGAAASALSYQQAERARERAEGLSDQVALVEAKVAAEARARVADAARLDEARRRAEATVPYLRVVRLLDRNLESAVIRDEVLPALEEALALDPTFVEALIAIGVAHANLTEFGPARASLEEAHQVAIALADASGRGLRGSPRALLYLGEIAQQLGDPKAGDYFDRAAQLDPRDPYCRAARLRLSPDLEAARQLVAEFPSLAEVHAAYAHALSKQGGMTSVADLEEAERFFTRGLQALQPNETWQLKLAQYRWERGWIRVQRDRFQEGLSDLEQVRDMILETQDAEIQAGFLLCQGIAQLNLDRLDEGLASLDAAVARSPTFAAPRIQAAIFLLRADRPGAALSWLSFEPAADVDPRVLDTVRVLTTVAAAETGDLAGAVRAFVQLGDRARPHRGELATIPRWEERLFAALAALAEYARDNGGDPRVSPTVEKHLASSARQLFQGARARLAQRDFEGAIEFATKALVAGEGLQEPDSTAMVYLRLTRAQALLRFDRLSEAAADFEAALALEADPKLAPMLRDARVALAKCYAILNVDKGRLADPIRDEIVRLVNDAVGMGYSKLDALRADPAFLPLQNDSAWEAVLERLR